MYIYKEGINFQNQKTMCQVIGISEATMSRILNKKQACRKVVAYCITKAFKENAEIQDYFTQIK